MKKTLIAALLVTPMAIGVSTAMAAPNNVGCGLGSTLFDGQSGIGPQILAATTNGTSGNQTFGITTGTLGCDEGGVVQASAAVTMFVGSNLDGLSRDMSLGQGETLESLAQLMGISAQDKGQFFATSKQNFGKIFASNDITAGKVLDNLYSVLSTDAQLSAYVRS